MMRSAYNNHLCGDGRPTDPCFFFKIHCPLYRGAIIYFFNLIIYYAQCARENLFLVAFKEASKVGKGEVFKVVLWAIGGFEEGDKVTFLVDAVYRSSQEGEEEDNQDGTGTLRTFLLNRDGSTLERGEGRGVFLYFGFCHLQLGSDLRIGSELQLQLVFEFGDFTLATCKKGMSIGICIGGTLETGLFVTCLGFLVELLIISQIDTGFLGSVFSDKLLEMVLNRVSHGRSNQRVLVGDIDGNDCGLFIDITHDFLTNLLNNACLFLGQLEGIHLSVTRFWFRKDTPCGLHGNGPPWGFLTILQIVVVGHGLRLVLPLHLYGEEGSTEGDTIHQVGVQIRHDSIRTSTGGIQIDSEAAGQGGEAARSFVPTGNLWCQHDRTFIVVGDAEHDNGGNDEGRSKHLVV